MVKVKNKFCYFLLLLLLLPIFMSIFVFADATTNLAYNDAKDGDLLYHANFNGTIGVWEPTVGWDGMPTAQVSQNGEAITLIPNNGKNTQGIDKKSCFGGALNVKEYTAIGCSYTVTFTLEASDEKQFIGFLPDWQSGFMIYPSAKKVSVGRAGNATKIAKAFTYESSDNGAQTYAVEFSVSNTSTFTVDNATYYTVNSYKLYVKENNHWILLRELNETERQGMRWSNNDPEMVLRFSRLGCYTDQTNGSVTVSDLNVYRGVITEEKIKTLDGAAIKINTTSGIRFKGSVDKTYLDGLKTKYGEENVKTGLLITKTEYLTSNALSFTMESLDACVAITGEKYKKIYASTILDSEDKESYLFQGEITSIKEAEYGIMYSAIAFIETAGNQYEYALYEETNHARSVSVVADMALSDVADKKVVGYENKVSIDSQIKYSPYTEKEREVLTQFCEVISVVSYNTKVYSNSKGWDGRDPDAAVISVKNLNADIVGFQEVNQTYLDGWDDSLSILSKNGYTWLKGNGNGHERLDIFYKTSKFDEIKQGTCYYKEMVKSLNVPNRENADMSRDDIGTLGKGRMFGYVILKVKSTGKVILVVNTHLHYNGTGSGYEEDDKVRRYEIQILLTWLESMKQEYPNQIIMGDMNSHYLSGQGEVNMGLYEDAGFRLSCKDAQVKGDNYGTLAITGRTVRPEWVFDYVLVNNKFDIQYYSVVDNRCDQNNTSYPSDHLPIITRIVLK